MKKLWNNTNAGFILLNIVIVLALCLCSGIGTVNGRTVSVIESCVQRVRQCPEISNMGGCFFCSSVRASVSCSASDCFYRLPADYM